jgi:pyridoxal phosphate enzyme (YggS family)
MDIETQKLNIEQQITDVAAECGRNRADIRLLAVSKTRHVDDIRKLASLGQLEFGENYLQESAEKIPQLVDEDIVWHFIGQLQRNKTRTAAALYDWVQSVDRLVIAERLSAQRPEHMPDLNICLQVRMSNEPGKGGIPSHELMQTAESIQKLPRITLRGLMTIPENTSDEIKLRSTFHQMYNLYTELQSQYPDVDTLSMGMSGDFQIAIEEGSTMVRIGTALFGPRNYAGDQT